MRVAPCSPSQRSALKAETTQSAPQDGGYFPPAGSPASSRLALKRHAAAYLLLLSGRRPVGFKVGHASSWRRVSMGCTPEACA